MASEASKMLYLITFLSSSPTPSLLLLQPHWIPVHRHFPCWTGLPSCTSVAHFVPFFMSLFFVKPILKKKKSKQNNKNPLHCLITLNLYYSSSIHHHLACYVYLIIYCLSLPIRLGTPGAYGLKFTAVSQLSELSLAYGTCSVNIYGINKWIWFIQSEFIEVYNKGCPHSLQLRKLTKIHYSVPLYSEEDNWNHYLHMNCPREAFKNPTGVACGKEASAEGS